MGTVKQTTEQIVFEVCAQMRLSGYEMTNEDIEWLLNVGELIRQHKTTTQEVVESLVRNYKQREEEKKC